MTGTPRASQVSVTSSAAAGSAVSATRTSYGSHPTRNTPATACRPRIQHF